MTRIVGILLAFVVFPATQGCNTMDWYSQEEPEKEVIVV